MMEFSGLHTILLDLDNTLIDRSAAVESYFSNLLTQHQPKLSQVSVKKSVKEILEQDQLGYADRKTFCRWVVNNHLPCWSAEQLWSDFSENMPLCIHPDANCLRMLDRLKERFFLAVVTNGSSRIQRAKLRASRIDESIEEIVISEEVGVEKPHPLIFQKAIQTHSASPDQTLYVGDHPETDVVGALNTGMKSCWVTMKREYPSEIPPPHFQISTIDSLRFLLQ